MVKQNLLTIEDAASFLAKMAEKSESVYWLSTPDFNKIKYISPAFEKIWGRPREILYAEPELWITYLHPDDVANHHPIHEMAERVKKQGPNARYDENYRIIRPDGEIRYIVDRGFPIYDDNGECCGVTGVAVDITEEKNAAQLQAEKLLIEQQNNALREQIKLLRRQATTLAHELKTPLGAIKFNLSTIASVINKSHDDTLTDILTKTVRIIDQEVDLASAFINIIMGNVRDLSKIAIDKETMADCITSALERYPYEEQHERKLININDLNDFEFMGNKELMIHVLFNLIKNALYFIEQMNKGEITIWTEIGTYKNTLHFKDTAKGMSQTQLAQIFDEFFSDTGIGTGIGLYFCKKVIEAFGGSIECNTLLGEFTHFIISLPKINEPESN